MKNVSGWKWLKWIPLWVFGIFFLVSAVILLAFAQMRSSSGTAYDVWRLNYTSNKVGSEELKAKWVEYRRVLLEDTYDLNRVQNCLVLFDDNGNLKEDKLADVTKNTVEEAKKKGIDPKLLQKNRDFEAYYAITGLMRLQSDINWYKDVVQQDSADLNYQEELIKRNREQLEDLEKGHTDLLALREMEKVPFEKPFIAAPYDLLLLLLVISMGVVGGVVRLLREYADPRPDTNPTFTHCLVLPASGAVVAIGGYVLAKSGLLLLSSTAAADSSLSPFMISVVSIIAGLSVKEMIDYLAEKAPWARTQKTASANAPLLPAGNAPHRGR